MFVIVISTCGDGNSDQKMGFSWFGLFQLGLNLASLSLCVELRRPVLSSIVLGLALSFWLLAPPPPPPPQQIAVSCPPVSPPHPLQDVDFTLDAKFALFGCTGNFDESFFFKILPPFLNDCP